MQGKQAKILNARQETALLRHLETTRYPLRDTAMFLLSVKAGLRAKEIAALTWSMVTDAEGQVGVRHELRDGPIPCSAVAWRPAVQLGQSLNHRHREERHIATHREDVVMAGGVEPAVQAAEGCTSGNEIHHHPMTQGHGLRKRLGDHDEHLGKERVEHGEGPLQQSPSA